MRLHTALTGPAPTLSESTRTWAMLAHLSALAAFSGIPLGNIMGPLIIYLIKKDDEPFVAVAGRESLNFQILMAILLLCVFAVYIATFFIALSKNQPPFAAFLVLPLFLVLFIFDFVSVIIAAVRTYKGETYRYPVSVRFVR